ncbi:MAG: flagellar protein FlaG [Pseudomonas sp.]|nr:flagellar protein FlaG [Pseudomonas sp.]
MDINAIGGLSQSSAAARPARPDSDQQIDNVRVATLVQAEKPQPASPQVQGRASMEEAVSSIKAFAQSIQRNLNFALDDSTGRVVVKVTDGVSGEVIRQIPSEDALRLAESLDEVRSLLFKAEA